MRRRYCLISPCRNEGAFIRRTLDSVLAQAEPPAKWVFVDDGSTDETASILGEYASRFDLIEIIRRKDRGCRSVGSGVVEAFNVGLNSIELNDYDFICKLDADLILPDSYFATLMDRMQSIPRLGSCSGKPYYPAPSNRSESFDGPLISEGIGDDVSVGAAKFYRVSCFQQLGGFVPEIMWDGIDCHLCRMKGWIVRSWDDPDLRFIHLRPMGSSDRGIVHGRIRHGRGQYFMGTSWWFMLASAIFRLRQRPRLIGGTAMACGYLESMLRRRPRYANAEFRRFLRQYHWKCLTSGKHHAMAAMHGELAADRAGTVEAMVDA